MMPGQRQMAAKLKQSAKRQKRPPETDDEFLDQGVSFEEAAEKWQAGDSEKASRFYVRALQTYDEALKIFPRSADLTYNKARIQYTITQVPAIRANFPGPMFDLLQTALQTHRQALSLDPDNTDILFNTGQVLNSLAEVTKDSIEANKMLQEAVATFEQCLGRQELMMQKHQVQLQQSSLMPSDTAQDGGTEITEDREDLELTTSQWASIIEPVTQSSLVDTAVAILDTFSSLCTTTSDGPLIASMETLSRHLLLEKLPSYLNGLEDEALRTEATCASAKFRAAFSEMEFRLRHITYGELDGRLQQIFEFGSSNEPKPPEQSSDFLICLADAWMSFAVARGEETSTGVLRFKRLTKALDCLTEASKSPHAKNLASIHMARGDAELLRFSICSYDNVPETLRNTDARSTLLQNAVKFYRGAAATAQATPGPTDGIATTATIKKAVVECIIGASNIPLINLASSSNMVEAEIQKAINDMLEESLVREETLKSCLVL